jgi:spermidine synthase
VICIFIILFGRFSAKNPKTAVRPVLLAIGTTGFSEIVFEIVVILSFQIVYGFLYYKLGVMLTSFMVGLFLGSVYITKRLDAIRDPYSLFLKIQTSIIAYPLILPVIFYITAQSRTAAASWLGSNVIFPFLPVVAGFIGGLQFPLGNKIYLSLKAGAGRAGGLTYGIDLLGACLGAIIVSAFLIPVLGVFNACLMVVLLNLSALISLLPAAKRLRLQTGEHD